MSKTRRKASPPLSRRHFGKALALGAGALGASVAGAHIFGGEKIMQAEPATPSSGRMPTGFVAHGAPTLALDADKGADFLRWGRALTRPHSVLVVSAHWEGAPITIGTTSTRELMYDFYGFPEALYKVRYPAPGAPGLATRVEGILGAAGERVRRDESRALDHGVWVPLVHMFPDASVPVLQLSMPSSLGARALFDVGRRLAALRDEGVLILGSGNLTHNLRRVDFSGASAPPAWASEFDAWIGDVLSRRAFDELIDYAKRAPALRDAHPTEEHLQPVLIAAGAASDGDAVSFPIGGFEFGSLSRRSVQLG